MTLSVLWLCAGCEKADVQDGTVYGKIEMINACEESIEIGRLYLESGTKDVLTEEYWPEFYASKVERGEDLELDYIDNLGFSIESTKCGGHTVYTFGSKDYDMIILYLHGGAYCNNASELHFTACNDIASMDGHIKVVLPIYPLTPQHTWEETFNLLDELYTSLLKEGEKIVIMGDSAGGGLACAFSQHLHKTGKPVPSKRVLISPWLDVTFSDPEAYEVEPRDAMLSIYGLVQLGSIWNGSLDEKDYRISPLYGDLDDGIDTLITVGTSEIMMPDCTTLYNRLVANHCRTTIVYGLGLWHVFTIFNIPEGKEARESILKFIRQ